MCSYNLYTLCTDRNKKPLNVLCLSSFYSGVSGPLSDGRLWAVLRNHACVLFLMWCTELHCLVLLLLMTVCSLTAGIVHDYVQHMTSHSLLGLLEMFVHCLCIITDPVKQATCEHTSASVLNKMFCNQVFFLWAVMLTVKNVYAVWIILLLNLTLIYM